MCNANIRNTNELIEVLNKIAESGELTEGAYINSWDEYKQPNSAALEAWVKGAVEELGMLGAAEIIVGLENALAYTATFTQLRREPRSVSNG